MENIHSTYSLLIDTFIDQKTHLFNAIETVPSGTTLTALNGLMIFLCFTL